MPRTVRAFHGTTLTAARSITSGHAPWRPSANAHDWLGHGIYFFEESLSLAVDWALGVTRQIASLGQIDSPAVIAADIDLTDCVDLCSGKWNANLSQIYSKLSHPIRAQHAPRLTTAAGIDHDIGDQVTQQVLAHNFTDTAVIDTLCRDLTKNGTPVTCKRAAFSDGDQLYTNSYFFRRTQIQIAALDLSILSNCHVIHPVPVVPATTNLLRPIP